MNKKNIIIMLCLILSGSMLFADPFNMVVQGGSGAYTTGLIISPDSNYFLSTTSTGKTMLLWQMDGKLVAQIPIKGSVMSGAAFTADSKYIVVHDFDIIRFYNIHGNVIKEINEKDPSGMTFINYYGQLDVNPVKKEFATGLYNNKGYGVGIYDFDGNCIKIIRGFETQASQVIYSPDGKLLAVHSFDSMLRIYDNKGNLLKTLSGYPVGLYYLKFSDNSQLIISASYSGYSVANTNGVFLINKSQTMQQTGFSSDGKLMVSGYYKTKEPLLRITDINGKEIKILEGLATSPMVVRFTPDNQRILCGQMDGSIVIWNVENGQRATLANSNDDWVIFTPDGYFDCSLNGSKIVAMVKGLDAFGVDQFAVQYNRPDIILERLGVGNQEQIAYYHNIYLKRLKKAGLKESELGTELHVPEAKIMKMETKDKQTKMTFELSDSKVPLKSYNIYVNDVPLFGAYGKTIDAKQKLTLTETIELTSGENKIELSCFNSKGAESFRALDYARYQEKTRGSLFFIGFGVSSYKDKALDLKYAHKDILDFAKLLQKYKKDYRNLIIKTYINEQVTVNNINAAAEFIKSASVDDTFILLIAGHGVHDVDGTYYYLTHETNLDHLSDTAAPFHLIENLMNLTPARNKLFLMDTCESGEQDDTIESSYFYLADARGIKARTVRGLKSKNPPVKKEERGLKKGSPTRMYLLDRDRYIFNDLFRRSGAIVFSSSRGGEFSYEKDEIQNGLFTEELMKALTTSDADSDSDGMITTDEMRYYVMKKVSQASDHLQNPTVDRDNIYQKFGFPLTK